MTSVLGALGLGVLAAFGCGSTRTAPDANDAGASVQPKNAAKATPDAVSARVSADASDISISVSPPGHGGDEALGEVPSNLQRLLHNLRSSDPEVMGNAVDELVSIRDSAYSKLSDIALRGEPPAVRDRSPESHTARRNVEIFWNVTDSRLIPILERRLLDSNAEIRRVAVRALAYFGNDAHVVQLLAERLSDESVEVRRETARAFDSIISGNDLVSLCDTCGRVGVHGRSVMSAVSGVVPALIERLSDTDAQVRKETAGVFSLLGDARALPKLRELAGTQGEEQYVLIAVENAITSILSNEK